MTDPARELAEICVRLQRPADQRGDEVLAQKLNVEAWSKEFYQVVFCIIERADFLISIIDDLDLDEDFRHEAVSHINAIKGAFNRQSLSSAWKSHGAPALAAQNVQPLKMLAISVRQKVMYPKLTNEERQELLGEVDQLTMWLNDHQIKDQDFIRQALLEGLAQMRFRLERVEWLGWGYTLEALREVIGAYMALERGIGDADNPTAKVALKKIEALVRKVYDTTSTFKDVVETSDFMLRAYGAACLVAKTGSIAGLLPSS